MDNPLRVTKKLSLSLSATSGTSNEVNQLVDPPVPPEPPEPPYVTGGPAFPANPSDANAEIVGSGGYGVSILDYFAAHVMAGLAMRSDLSLDVLKADGAKHAYWIAAEMVNLRNELPIEPTPVPVTPPPESGEMPPVMPSGPAAETIVKLGNAPSS